MPRAVWSKCLPVPLWPPACRAAWEAAMRPGDPFEDASVASRWSPATRRKTVRGFGRFLFWLKKQNQLDETSHPTACITQERLTAYLEELRTTNRGHTIQNRIQELGDAMRALAPDVDWGFIRRAAGRLRADTVPARDKLGRMPGIADVLVQGYRMMDAVEEAGSLSELGRAALYRDGVLLVFLAYHPLRLRNLSSLRIGHHLVFQGEQTILKIPAAEAKSPQHIERELSPRLASAMSHYIRCYRPVLMRAKGRWHWPATNELWISRDGSPCNPQTFRNIIKKHLVGPDGRPLSPHLFRSIVGTSIAIEAPDSVDLIPTILGHRSHRTGEQYYNLAGGLSASRAFNAMLSSIRRDLDAIERPKERTDHDG